MRVQIWQQFSSNHSANFTVVGVFPSPEQASHCAEVITGMLKKIDQAQVEREAQGQIRFGTITPVENEMSKQWDVDWNRDTLDWAGQYNYAARHLDNYVFIQNVENETHNGVRPVDQLVARLGGTPIVAEENAGTMVLCDVSCTADSEGRAAELYTALNGLFGTGQTDEDGFHSLNFEGVTPPWAPFSEKRRHLWRSSGQLYDGYLTQEAQRLNFTRLSFFDTGYGLPGLLAYLKAKKCSEIDYRIYLSV